MGSTNAMKMLHYIPNWLTATLN